jgi:multidrug resistance protein, MATE family
VTHPFTTAPHRTILALSVPVFFSLIAEPLTGLVDTAFVARLGVVPLAALGVGTAALSSVLWVFNFLGIGTQTEVAQAAGRDNLERAGRIAGLALLLSLLAGLILLVVGYGLAPPVARLLGATAELELDAVLYMRIRLWGAPAVLLFLAAAGALRGLQDMNTPLWIAIGVNALNIGLDALLIFGYGPIPALGIAGAALASVLAQWMGAVWGTAVVVRRLGWPQQLKWSEARRLLQIGGDLFVRTGMLMLFMLLTTRIATLIGAESGAAHQAIRQVWLFTGLGLDALAITAQSLIGYFLGAQQLAQARRVAWVTSFWGALLGALLGLLMWLGEDWAIRLLVPAAAVALFQPAWLVAVLVQPLNALAFVSDGIHWGTADFRFLRNVMLLASGAAGGALLLLDESRAGALTWVWIITGAWISIRAALGLLRVWPGIGRAPLGKGHGLTQTSS